MTSFSLNFFSNQIQCSHVFVIMQFRESSNLKQSYYTADRTRDFPCIPVLPENFQSAPPVFWSALVVTHSFYFMCCQSYLLTTVISFQYKDKWWWLIFFISCIANLLYYTSFHNSAHSTVVIYSAWNWNPRLLNSCISKNSSENLPHHVNTNKCSVVTKSGNDVEGCRTHTVCFNPICLYFCNTV